MSIRRLWAASLYPVPNLWATVLEELKKFRNHNVEWLVQSVTVQQLRRVLADLLQCSKRALRHGHTQRGCQIKTQTYTDKEERIRWHQKICHRQTEFTLCPLFVEYLTSCGQKNEQKNPSEADFCHLLWGCAILYKGLSNDTWLLLLPKLYH